MESVVVDVQNVSLYYQEPHAETLAIRDLAFSVREGEFVSIVGPSGCGKTSLLSLLMGLLPPSEGTVEIRGRSDDCRPSVGYMLQRDHLLDWRTVEGNVLLSLEVKGLLTPERRARAKCLLEKYGLAEFARHYPPQLSGGMRQKVALIRTLAFDPELLLLDEPFSALDYQTRLRVADEVYGIIRSEGKTAVLVTHDIAEAVSMSDRVLVFSSRPARLLAEHAVSLPTALPPFERRNAPGFSELFHTIWKEIAQDEEEA